MSLFDESPAGDWRGLHGDAGNHVADAVSYIHTPSSAVTTRSSQSLASSDGSPGPGSALMSKDLRAFVTIIVTNPLFARCVSPPQAAPTVEPPQDDGF